MPLSDLIVFGGAITAALVVFLVMTWQARRFDRRWGKEPPRSD